MKQKLELTWIGKEARPQLEPRILLAEHEQSYHAKRRVTGTDLFDNRLIFGDNLLALKALEQEFTGKVKCVFIDPPYNTGSAFTHYDDGLEHSIWLGLMRDRLEIIRRLMAEDGSLWITIDDHEAHYLKVLCDEIFGRGNFVSNLIWQKKTAPQGHAQWFSDNHDHVLVIAKNKQIWHPNPLARTERQNARYNRADDPRGMYTPDNFTISLTGGARGAQYAKTGVSDNIYPITLPSGRTVLPPKGRCWLVREERYFEMLKENLIVFAKNGDGVPMIKRFLNDVKQGIVPLSVMLHRDVGGNTEAKKEVREFNSVDIFSTPKPEKLIQRVLELATRPNDLVLDSFAGSGTTGAVAHKMGRRWIMVELGEHCHTHIIPRLRKVIDGADPGGITQSVGWQGGGGFRYYRLAPSLLQQDRWGQWIINKAYNAEMLAAAICKLEGFTYAPSDTHYWQQGKSSENDFIYVTTQRFDATALQDLSDDVAGFKPTGATLLVCCSAFRGDTQRYPNLTVKKIPKMVLSRCEWGHDDYSLNIENLPMVEKMTAGQAVTPQLVALFEKDQAAEAT